MRLPRVLVLSGSVRSGSYNTKLAALVGKRLALSEVDVTRISLADYPLPIYDGDLEASQGLPHNAQVLKSLFLQQEGIFIACPEYNAGIAPLLKNALDWISRSSAHGEPSKAAFKNRIFAIGAAATGSSGGLRGLIGMRTIMEVGLGAHLLPQMVTVTKAQTGFDSKGDLTDDRAAGQLDALVQAMVRQTQLHMFGR
ncbi:NADPH-dependent FMN reductase [Roseibium sp.]|uniref:NADPH-dependent FMN reductase n=1 Tax=Roseibium sp. TaxID=1936156 RepID=UPI003A97807E